MVEALANSADTNSQGSGLLEAQGIENREFSLDITLDHNVRQ
jgi:hypothetical protein